MVAEDEEEEDSDVESESILALRFTKEDLTASTVCITCGGRGHVSQLDGVVCATKENGITIPRSELSQTKYPGGVKFPNVPEFRGAKYASKKPSPFNKNKKFKPRKPSSAAAKQVTEEEESDDEEGGEEEEPDQPEGAITRMALAFDTLST